MAFLAIYSEKRGKTSKSKVYIIINTIFGAIHLRKGLNRKEISFHRAKSPELSHYSAASLFSSRINKPKALREQSLTM